MSPLELLYMSKLEIQYTEKDILLIFRGLAATREQYCITLLLEMDEMEKVGRVEFER